MNDILVGIDFSECSINALEHALSIASKAEKDIMEDINGKLLGKFSKRTVHLQ